MVQFLPRQKSFGERIAQGFAEGSRAASQLIPEHLMKKEQERKKLETAKRLGLDIEGLSPESQEEAFKQHFAGEKERTKYKAKYEEMLNAMQNAGLTSKGRADQEIEEEALNAAESELGQANDSEIKAQEGNVPKSSLSRPKERQPHSADAIARMAIINPTVANNWQRQNEDFFRRKQHQETIELGKEKEAKKTAREFHLESSKYDENILDSYKKSINQMEAIKNIENALRSGNISPKSAANLFRGMGNFGDKIANALLNEDQATLLSSIPYLIEGWKDIFGVRLSDADLRVIQDKLPDMGKSPEANLAITRIMKKYAGMAQLRYGIGKEIKAKNNKLRPLGYADEVEDAFAKRMAPVRVRNPNTGNVIEIPAYQASQAIENGGELVNE